MKNKCSMKLVSLGLASLLILGSFTFASAQGRGRGGGRPRRPQRGTTAGVARARNGLVLWPSPPWEGVTYWALDLETGGLEPARDPIIAVGMLPIRAGRVRLGEGYRTLVRPADGRPIDPASVRAHQLVWGEVKDAPPVADVLPEVHRRIADGVLLVHHKGIDVAFLKDAYRRCRMRWPT